jgi:hypothetical protein
MDTQEPRFTGPTRECFAHLMQHSADPLRTMEYVAEFCRTGKVGIAAVLDWWRGKHFPGGEQLVRLRFLLYLAGYNVTETANLTDLVRKVSFIVAAKDVDSGRDIITPEVLSSDLGYAEGNTYGLWNVLLKGANYLKSVGEGLEDVRRRKIRYLHPYIKATKPEILALIKESQVHEMPVRELPSLNITSTSIVADHISRGLSDLLRALIEAGDIDALLLATNGGIHFKELRRLIDIVVE